MIGFSVFFHHWDLLLTNLLPRKAIVELPDSEVASSSSCPCFCISNCGIWSVGSTEITFSFLDPTVELPILYYWNQSLGKITRN
jgi:hypothetical protein